MAKKILKRGVGDLVDVSLTGITLGQVGSNFTGANAGIGRATQAIIAVGAAKRSAKRNKLI